MPYDLLADTVVIIHLGFILFALFGGLLVLKWRWLVWAHLPAFIWATLIEFYGWICPLTHLENRLRTAAGKSTLDRGFVEEYLLPVLYPTGLTREQQVYLGLAVAGINLIIYGLLTRRLYKSRQNEQRQPRGSGAGNNS